MNDLSGWNHAMLNSLLSTLEKTIMSKLDSLEKKIEEIENMIRYSPGQSEFEEAKQHWESCVTDPPTIDVNSN